MKPKLVYIQPTFTMQQSTNKRKATVRSQLTYSLPTTVELCSRKYNLANETALI